MRRSTTLCAFTIALSFSMASCAPPDKRHEAQMFWKEEGREGGRRIAVLTSDFYYCYSKTGDVIRVPEGYATDFASVPKYAWFIANPYQEPEAAIVHDYLYTVGPKGDETARSYADSVYLAALKDYKANTWRANLMHKAVEHFGAKNFGGEKEWTDRFYNLITHEKIAPPLAHPEQALIRTDAGEHCELFKSKTNDIYREYPSKMRIWHLAQLKQSGTQEICSTEDDVDIRRTKPVSDASLTPSSPRPRPAPRSSLRG